MPITLLDYDWAVYRVCFSDKSLDEKIESVDSMLSDILTKTEATDHRIFLAGSNNFRYKIFPDYKANRKNKEKPDHYNEVKAFLVDERGAILSHGFEADDLCAMYQTKDTLISSEDKDILTIPGRHYRIKKNWDENHFLEISEEEAMLNFWIQTLTGDSSDGITGVKNPEKSHHKNPPCFSYNVAKELLENSNNKKQTVIDMYEQHYGDDWFSRFDVNLNCLWLKRSINDSYHFHI